MTLPRQSKRTRQKQGVRSKITAANRFAGICELARLGGCEGPIDTHEVVRRNHKRDVDIDRRFQVALCRRHHGLDTHIEVARQHGIRVDSWAWDQYGMRALREAKAIRMEIFMGKGPRDPFWADEPLPPLPHPDAAFFDS